MKKASRARQAEYDRLQSKLYKQLKAVEESLYQETKEWSAVFEHPVYQDAEKLWASHRNSCPECLHPETEVVNYDEMWRDGDVVCKRCGVYVRGYDAG